jgi:NADH-quinone oxidoreductase subunit A
MADFDPTDMPQAALAIHVALSTGIVLLAIGVAFLLRERRRSRTLDAAYESGIVAASPPDRPLNAPYFIIAALFVVFDMAAALLLVWGGVAERAGWNGLVGGGTVVMVLLAALTWLKADGALDFGASGGQ